jgi:small conductance mechanosensitive channel
MSTDLIRRVARPYLVRAILAAVLALAGLVIAESFGDPTNGDLIDKLTSFEGPAIGVDADSDTPARVVPEDLVAVGGAIIFLLAGVVAVRGLTQGAGRAVEHQLGPARGAPLSLFISIVGYGILALTLLNLLGVDLSGFLLGGAITGIIVGIAAQQTLGNAFAGMVLLIVRPFVVGERVVLKSGALGGEYEGRVADISLFYVDLETERGPVKLPNAGVLAGAVGPGARSAKSGADDAEESPQAGPEDGGATREP